MAYPEGLTTDSDRVWLPAILAGVASMPVTVALQTLLSTYSLSAMMLVGTGVGYLYRNRSTMGIRVGTRMGLIGSLPALWLNVHFLETLVAGIGEGLTVGSIVETAQIVLFFLLVIGFSTLMGFAGTVMGIQTARYNPSTDVS